MKQPYEAQPASRFTCTFSTLSVYFPSSLWLSFQTSDKLIHDKNYKTACEFQLHVLGHSSGTLRYRFFQRTDAKEALDREPTDDLMVPFFRSETLDCQIGLYIHTVWQKEWYKSAIVSSKLHEILPKPSGQLLLVCIFFFFF